MRSRRWLVAFRMSITSVEYQFRGARWQRRAAVRQSRLDRLLDSVKAQKVRESFAVPELLIDPARKEGRDLRIGGHTGSEQVAQVDDRVGFDVHHVLHAHHVSVREMMFGHVVPVDHRQIDLL